jgi:hypothetical protein
VENFCSRRQRFDSPESNHRMQAYNDFAMDADDLDGKYSIRSLDSIERESTNASSSGERPGIKVPNSEEHCCVVSPTNDFDSEGSCTDQEFEEKDENEVEVSIGRRPNSVDYEELENLLGGRQGVAAVGSDDENFGYDSGSGCEECLECGGAVDDDPISEISEEDEGLCNDCRWLRRTSGDQPCE